MRHQSINVITLYMVIGSVLNIASIIYIVGLHIEITEAIMTIAALNGCYIFIARDISKKHEQICSNRNHVLKRGKTSGIGMRR